MSEMHLCEECARQKSVQMEQQFGLADLLAGLSDFGKQVKDKEETKLVCQKCALSYDDFRKFGRLGCSHCYSSFETHLSNLLKKIHGSNHHYGKKPMRIPEAQQKKMESLQDFKSQLAHAIQIEDFEKAAELRDKIREIEKKDKNG